MHTSEILGENTSSQTNVDCVAGKMLVFQFIFSNFARYKEKSQN